MEVPTVGADKAEDSGTEQPTGVLSKAASCWSSNKSVWIGLAVLLLGVVGEVLLYTLPGQYYVQSQAGEYFYGHYQLLNSLQVVCTAAVYLGAFWVGGYMAFWGFRKK
jgi:hypothetical protein